jgi:hypothetical protein
VLDGRDGHVDDVVVELRTNSRCTIEA